RRGGRRHRRTDEGGRDRERSHPGRDRRGVRGPPPRPDRRRAGHPVQVARAGGRGRGHGAVRLRAGPGEAGRRGTDPGLVRRLCYNKTLMRDCGQCGHELEPFFDSTCEPPVAWLCQGCGSVTLEEDLRALSPSARSELATLRAFIAPVPGDGRAPREPQPALGRAGLEHSTLVASGAPGTRLTIPEPRRRVEEREARRFAAEVLMPEEKIRGRFAELAPRIDQALGLRQRQAETDEVVTALARMFAVSPTAMRTRLQELDLIR